MKRFTIAIVISQLLVATLAFAQQHPLEAFKNLAGSTWVSEGEQLGGYKGKTEKQFAFGLEGRIIKVKTFSTDPKTLEFGLRNEGIRAWNAQDSLIYFYEFDKFGGITTGQIRIQGKDLHYEYQYQGLMLRDSWQYIDPDRYHYTVGVWDKGAWKQKFHESEFVRKK